MNEDNLPVAQVTLKDIQKAEHIIFNADQLNLLLKGTPKKYIKTRPAKGGGTWDYVATSYVQKVLNLLFGWDWDFIIEKEDILETQVVVRGRLVCRTRDKVIQKTQYGRKDIVMRKGTKEPLDIGNDLKAAASDALKKCASMVGVAADIYGKDDFTATEIIEPVVTGPEEEKKRVKDWIESSTTLEKLAVANEAVEQIDDSELRELFENKRKELESK